jgi:hypothetical protein
MNGWHNRATWNVTLWLANDEPRYLAMLDWFARTKVTQPKVRAMLASVFEDGVTPDGDKVSDADMVEVTRFVREHVG